MHAGSRAARRDHKPGRLGSRDATRRTRGCRRATCARAGVRVSIFVDPTEAPIRWAADVGADRVELYTEPFARAFERGQDEGQQSFATYARAAELAHSLGLGVNAGHDLDLDNLVLFRSLPHLDEVSIGHALISHALFVGLAQSVQEYL